MSDGNRDVTTALAVVICFAMMWGLGVWAGTYNEARRAYYEESEAKPYEGALDAGSFWKERGGSPKSYAAICNSPKDETQADLCQQWRSANAAEQMSGYALVSLIFGLVGLVGVGVTVHLSNKATNAATRATEAAVRSAEAAERTNVAQHRAWLKVEAVEVGPLILIGDHLKTNVSFKATNIGKYPAVDVIATGQPYSGYSVLAGRGEIDATIDSAFMRAMRKAGNGFILLPDDFMTHSFASDRAQPLPQRFITPNQTPDDLAVSFVIVFSYRSTVSDEWFHTGHIAYVRRDGMNLKLSEGEVPASVLQLGILPGSNSIS